MNVQTDAALMAVNLSPLRNDPSRLQEG